MDGYTRRDSNPLRLATRSDPSCSLLAVRAPRIRLARRLTPFVPGQGWYFSKYARHAQHYTSGGNALLLVEVAVGNTETVVRRDVRGIRRAPSAGFDAMVVPGRRLPSAAGLNAAGGGEDEVGEEYVIFDGSQALPLCLVFFDE